MTPLRFIIITVPPPETAERIEAMRRELTDLTGSRGALAYPPHVTLRTGALVPPEEEERFVRDFAAVLDGQPPVPVRTGGVVCTDYVSSEDGARKHIVLLPVETNDALVALNRRLLTFTRFRKSAKTRFRPHVTLAFEDLTSGGLARAAAWIAAHRDRYSPPVAWTCDNVRLCAEEDGAWRDRHVFSLVDTTVSASKK